MIITSDKIKDAYDLIIVGSGPAGITTAKKYTELSANKNVLIIESGDISHENNIAQQLSNNHASGDIPSAHYKMHSQRTLGSSSSIWNGFCAVLEKRSFLNKEWPISYEELYKYYPEASKILELPKQVYDRAEVPFKDNPNVIYRPYYLSRPTRFNNNKTKTWLKEHKKVDIIFNYTVMKIDVSDGIATNIKIKKTKKNNANEIDISANNIVLAAGGIQNAKILKLSILNKKLPIGNYFQEHPHVFGEAWITLDINKFNEIKDNSTKRIFHAISLSS